MLTQDQVQTFNEQGYIVLPAVADKATVKAMREKTFESLASREEPLELESSVNYPGAPENKDAPGGNTARRILMAYERDEIFRQWAHNEYVAQNIQQLLGSQELWLTPNHHNTVMTKHPKYSSDTLWQFLKLDYEGNQAQLAKAIYVELNAGDVLLFSPFIFHAADRCKTDEIKCSLVFTYHGEETVPVSNTKSDRLPAIRIL